MYIDIAVACYMDVKPPCFFLVSVLFRRKNRCKDAVMSQSSRIFQENQPKKKHGQWELVDLRKFYQVNQYLEWLARTWGSKSVFFEFPGRKRKDVSALLMEMFDKS